MHHSVRSRVVALLDARVVGVHDVIEATQHDGTVVGERAQSRGRAARPSLVERRAADDIWTQTGSVYEY